MGTRRSNGDNDRDPNDGAEGQERTNVGENKTNLISAETFVACRYFFFLTPATLLFFFSLSFFFFPPSLFFSFTGLIFFSKSLDFLPAATLWLRSRLACDSAHTTATTAGQ